MSKMIPLTKGKYAIVDDEDYEWLSKHKWCTMYSHNKWYAVRGDKNGFYLMHREILGLKPGDGKTTDHINGNGLDNKRCNIRKCTGFENQHNSISRKGSSRYKGVSWNKRLGKWHAYIWNNSKRKHLGYYESEKNAAIMYDLWAKELFGEFANLNFRR